MLTGLNPWLVAAHFLLSMVLVAVATDALAALPRAGRRSAAARAVRFRAAVAGDRRPSPPPSWWWAPSSPAAARTAATRRPAAPGSTPSMVSQLHADLVFLLIGLTAALLVALYATDSPDRVRRAARDLLIVELAQGADRLRAVLHATCRSRWCWCTWLGAVLITAFTARLVWSVRGPASELPLSAGARSRHRAAQPPPGHRGGPQADGDRAGSGDSQRPPSPPSAAGVRPAGQRRPRRARQPSAGRYVTTGTGSISASISAERSRRHGRPCRSDQLPHPAFARSRDAQTGRRR